ncbi:MAG: thioesterase family protein [Deltaproteobacteria bacterium]|nr:thioesterase family protein [Deltaproteobacteria bacterium]MBI4196353.1 thioesterase family protein [Deltaproteobacteria bacterium]
MNNGRYLTFMDLGRIDIILRSGLVRMVLKKKWRPLVGMQTIRYKKSLRLFQKFQLKTKILCWDEKWFYFEQRFERNGELIAIGHIKGLLRGPKGNVPTTEIIASLKEPVKSPPMPDFISKWQSVYYANTNEP